MAEPKPDEVLNGAEVIEEEKAPVENFAALAELQDQSASVKLQMASTFFSNSEGCFYRSSEGSFF